MMTVSPRLRFLIALVAVAVIHGFQSRLGTATRTILRQGSREKLAMANAFLSPSVITRQKRDEVMNDPFDSPSALINGGAGGEKCKSSMHPSKPCSFVFSSKCFQKLTFLISLLPTIIFICS